MKASGKDSFEPMSNYLPAGAAGSVEIRHFTPPASETCEGETLERRPHVELLINRRLVMSDTEMERETNRAFVDHAHGHVLIAGLGIGLVLIPILGKENVRSVTVVEKNRDLIDLVGPYFEDPKLTIYQGDIFHWYPLDGEIFDVIYFDIWPTRGEHQVRDMEVLHQRFARYLNQENPEAMISSWYQNELEREQREKEQFERDLQKMIYTPESEQRLWLEEKFKQEKTTEMRRRGFSEARIAQYLKYLDRSETDEVVRKGLAWLERMRLLKQAVPPEEPIPDGLSSSGAPD